MSYRGRVLEVKWPNQQCQSTKGSNGPKDQASIPPGPSHHVTILHMHTIYSYTYIVKWAQWDKTQSRELLVLFICECSSLCTTVAHNTAQNRPDNFPSCPPDNHHCSGDVYLRERGGIDSINQTSASLLRPRKRLWNIVMSMSVCVFVCPRGYLRDLCQIFVHVAYIRGSVLLRHLDDRPHRLSQGNGVTGEHSAGEM